MKYLPPVASTFYVNGLSKEKIEAGWAMCNIDRKNGQEEERVGCMSDMEAREGEGGENGELSCKKSTDRACSTLVGI